MKLKNATELAEAVGVSRTEIQAAKVYPPGPYIFTHGMRTTVKSYLDWKAAHPDFRQRVSYPRKAGSKPRARPTPGPVPFVTPADNAGESSSRRV